MNVKQILYAVVAATVIAAPSIYADTPGTPAGAAAGSTNSADAMTALFGDPVIASGTGVQVKRSELDQVVTGIKSAAEKNGQNIAPEQMTRLEAQMLERLIDIQLLLQKANDADKAAGTKKANDAMAQLLDKSGGSEATLDMQLEAAGTTKSELMTKVTQEATAMNALQRELGVDISDTEIKKFYDDHPSDFEEPEMVHVRHILLMTMDPTTRQPLSDDAVKAKRKQADDILVRARAGEDFAKLAQEYSDDTTTRQKGGELPPFGHGQMLPEFDAAAFSLTNNQISDVVTTMYGYHIIQMIGKTPAKTLALTDPLPSATTAAASEKTTVSDKIKEYLISQKTDELAVPYLDKLKKAANVKILDPDLNAAAQSLAAMMANTNSVPPTTPPAEK